MARFSCHACNTEGTFAYTGAHACPNCGSGDLQIALSIHELAYDDHLVALTKLADDNTDE